LGDSINVESHGAKPKTPGCITEVALFVPNDFPTLALEHPVLLALPRV